MMNLLNNKIFFGMIKNITSWTSNIYYSISMTILKNKYRFKNTNLLINTNIIFYFKINEFKFNNIYKKNHNSPIIFDLIKF